MKPIGHAAAIWCALTLPAVTAAATPDIDQQTVIFNQGQTTATISYTLSGAPAIVTCDIETNTMADASGEWVSIGGENLQTLSGDVHKVVRTGARKITWQSRAEWPEMKIPAGQIRAVLTAWATNAPPDYLVIGLDAKNDVRLYAKPDFVPYGINSDYYKTNAILMRKIPAAGVVWRMGSFEDEDSERNDAEFPHLVMLTSDYYMGVYELTQGQLMKFYSKDNPSEFQSEEDSPMRPVEKLNLHKVRGTGGKYVLDNGYWPVGGYDKIEDGTIVEQLRSKCGLKVDLPTEAQWEYACRAGTSTAFNDGSASTSDNMGALGWHTWNSTTNEVKQTHVVGMKRQNAWGLYDMHGNVSELCLNRYSSDSNLNLGISSPLDVHAVVVDPIGPKGELVTDETDKLRMVTKGGYFETTFSNCRSAARGTIKNTNEYNYLGCRLYAPAVFK
jgi:formylglycine-generating enzyme required for sulfatase activity